MSYYILYTDDSRESDRIERWLQGLGVPVLAVKGDGARIMPTVEWQEGRLEGTANIELYFERRGRSTADGMNQVSTR